jgi:hypothetical protein
VRAVHVMREPARINLRRLSVGPTWNTSALTNVTSVSGLIQRK